MKKYSHIFLFACIASVSFPAFACTESEYRDAIYEYRHENYVLALQKLQRLAKQGHAKSQLRIGVMYHKGWGTSQDVTKAVYWYRKAAEQGQAIAQHNLGWAYITGTGVKKNNKKAYYWTAKAANQGYHNAQTNLAKMYYNGVGVEINYKKAIELNEKAIKQGNKRAMNNLAWILSTCPDKNYRNGNRALKIVKELLLKHKRSPSRLDTMAAAYAELGMFKKAIEVQKEAISISHHIKDKNRRDKYKVRILWYEKGMPWRDKPDDH